MSRLRWPDSTNSVSEKPGTIQEIKMIEEAASDSKFAGVSAHIECALAHYADRENPDYRNSIKEAISAVESIARVVSGSDKATLGDALQAIEKSGQLHPALKKGFLAPPQNLWVSSSLMNSKAF